VQGRHHSAPDVAARLDVLDQGQQDGLVSFGVPVLKGAPSARGGSGGARSLGFSRHLEAETRTKRGGSCVGFDGKLRRLKLEEG